MYERRISEMETNSEADSKESIMILHNKLVRDKIPEIIEKAVKTPVMHILSDEEYTAELEKN